MSLKSIVSVPASPGKKIALSICINYKGTKHELRGCINDGITMKNFLAGYGYNEFISMTDNTPGERRPTAANIIKAIQKLADLSNNENYTHFFIQYSGHGSYVRDRNKDEADRRDECLVGIDLRMVLDDDLNKIFQKFAPTANVVFFCDACHSGTIIDLPYRMTSEKEYVIENKVSPLARIISLSGCRDSQTAADAYSREGKKPAGAFTDCFKTICDKPNFMNKNIYDFITQVNAELGRRRFSQRSQFCISRLPSTPLKMTDIL